MTRARPSWQARSRASIERLLRPRFAHVVAWLLALTLLCTTGWVLERRWYRMLDDARPLIPMEHALPGHDVSGMTTVPTGGSARYRGATWRLLSVRDDVAPVDWNGEPEPVRVPRGMAYRVATFEVRLDDERAREQLGDCSIEMIDGRADRSWSPIYVDLPEDACSRDDGETALRIRVQEAFLVPRDVADEVTPIVWAQEELPRYLRFER